MKIKNWNTGKSWSWCRSWAEAATAPDKRRPWLLACYPCWWWRWGWWCLLCRWRWWCRYARALTDVVRPVLGVAAAPVCLSLRRSVCLPSFLLAAAQRLAGESTNTSKDTRAIHWGRASSAAIFACAFIACDICAPAWLVVCCTCGLINTKCISMD